MHIIGSIMGYCLLINGVGRLLFWIQKIYKDFGFRDFLDAVFVGYVDDEKKGKLYLRYFILLDIITTLCGVYLIKIFW